MDYLQTTEYLFSSMPSFQSVGAEGYKPGLERIESFSHLVGDPHLRYPTIHVAGTNGKGSTSHMLASVLRSAGYRVGLFTSPHLRDFRERMRVDGESISEQGVVDFVSRWREDMERLSLSFFEMTAAMAFCHFAEERVDVAIIETGLGGRLDATNIILPELSIITNISIDHTQYLGTTLGEIATEKGGIIKDGRSVVVGERGDEYNHIFEQIAATRGSRIEFAEDMYSLVGSDRRGDALQCVEVMELSSGESRCYDLDLLGGYQCRNLITMLAAVRVINESESIPLSISTEALDRGLRSVVELSSLRGRWQSLGESPRIVCDTGHNEDGIREVAHQLERESCRRIISVMGFTREKDLRSIMPLLPRQAHYIFTEAKGERSMPIADIEVVARELGMSYESVIGVEAALSRATMLAEAEDLIFVGGSTFVVAEIIV